MKALLRLASRFTAEDGGNVALVLGLALLPAIGIFGYAEDYAVGLMAKRRLDSAADAAVLRAVSRSSNPNLDQPTRDGARAAFDAELGRATNITVKQFDLATSYVSGNLRVTLTYAATVPTYFGSLFAVPITNLSGTVVSVAPVPSYANFYLLLDNSPSMGIGATTDDMTRLSKLAPNGCVFACHQHSFNYGRITGDDTTDNYHIAKNNNITTRLDVERSAAQTLFNSAIGNQTLPNQYKAAIYTFSDVVQAISPLSSDLNDVQTKAANIDLAYAYADRRDAQTAYDTAMTYMSNIIGQGGSGQTSSNPLNYLFIVTDGVADQPTGDGSGSGDRPDGYQAPATGPYPPKDAMPNLANTLVGNFDNNPRRLIATISSKSTVAQSKCQALKDNGTKIAILYTQYLPVPDVLWTQYIVPFKDRIATDLQTCASPNLFFTVTPSGGIADAMKAMFTAATTGLPRLTQ